MRAKIDFGDVLTVGVSGYAGGGGAVGSAGVVRGPKGPRWHFKLGAAAGYGMGVDVYGDVSN